MSIFSAMMASVSGMQGQATMLSTISDNIANSGTTGYKQAQTAFEDMLNQMSKTSYTAGGVATNISYGISTQGELTSATKTTNMAISGNGFFVVQDSGGATYLTRAGDFTVNSSGNLVNSEGYTLLGYPASATSVPGTISQLSPITISTSGLSATATTSGTLTANLNSTAAVVATPPSAGGTSYTSMTTVTAYDSLGTPETLNVYYSNLGSGQWEVDVYNNGSPSTPATLVSSSNLQFDTTTGALTSGSPISVPVSASQTVSLDVSASTQLDSAFAVSANTLNGNAPASYKKSCHRHGWNHLRGLFGWLDAGPGQDSPGDGGKRR